MAEGVAAPSAVVGVVSTVVVACDGIAFGITILGSERTARYVRRVSVQHVSAFRAWACRDGNVRARRMSDWGSLVAALWAASGARPSTVMLVGVNNSLPTGANHPIDSQVRNISCATQVCIVHDPPAHKHTLAFRHPDHFARVRPPIPLRACSTFTQPTTRVSLSAECSSV